MFMVSQKVGNHHLSHMVGKNNRTLCGIELGVGSGLKRDGRYGLPMCSVCNLKLIVGTKGESK